MSVQTSVSSNDASSPSFTAGISAVLGAGHASSLRLMRGAGAVRVTLQSSASASVARGVDGGVGGVGRGGVGRGGAAGSGAGASRPELSSRSVAVPHSTMSSPDTGATPLSVQGTRIEA